MIPPHIQTFARAALAARQRFHIVFSETHAVYQVLPVDAMREVLYQGSKENCEYWVECRAVLAGMEAK